MTAHFCGRSTMAEKQPPHRAVLVFSAPLVKELVTNEVRLPPTYVGVRRIRPSNWNVQNEFHGKKSSQDEAPEKNKVVFKITDANGVTRRMNSQEKKELKMKLKVERAEEKKRLKREAAEARAREEENEAAEQELKSPPLLRLPEQEGYHQLEVSQAALEEELADLRGDRNGVPPVMLSPPLANQALRSGGILSVETCCKVEQATNEDGGESGLIIDDELANRWATALKENMKPAEAARNEEDGIRAMPYQLMPEVWSRLRPESLSAGSIEFGEAINNIEKNESDVAVSTNVWSSVTVRQRRERLDSDTNLVVSVLHRQSNLHVSCGAKFGCDFLLYDGRRDERHAFAGLRIVERNSSQLPTPSPYDLTGFVRCLNTAGKLALVATVDRDESGVARIAFVDLALEKILQRGKRKRSRREAGMNLDKAH